MKRYTKQPQQRTLLAQQAAKLIAEQGFHDFEEAKKKASKMLGIAVLDQRNLPSNQEIQQALEAHHALFGKKERLTHVRTLQEKALRIMQILKTFDPKLAGLVLDGNASEHTPISIHVSAPTSEEVMIHFINLGIPYDALEQRLILMDKRAKTFPMFRIYLAGSAAEITVLPEATLQYTPRCPIAKGPMNRASLQDLEKLLR